MPDKELLWDYLVEDGYVSDVCHGPSSWEEFKEAAVRFTKWQWKMLGRSKPVGRPQHHQFTEDVNLTDLEREHAAALAPYLAKRAALLPEVRRFREEKLDGAVLDSGGVGDFLRSELSYLPPEQYADFESALRFIPSTSEGDEEELKDLVGGWVNRGPQAYDEYLSENARRFAEFDSTALEYVPSGHFLHGIMDLVRDEGGSTLADLGLDLPQYGRHISVTQHSLLPV